VPGRGLTSLIQIPVWYQPTRIYPVTNLVYKRGRGKEVVLCRYARPVKKPAKSKIGLSCNKSSYL
jgi:hypothetical protein